MFDRTAALWSVHMVQSGVQRALGPNLRRILGAALGNRGKAFLAGLGPRAMRRPGPAAARLAILMPHLPAFARTACPHHPVSIFRGSRWRPCDGKFESSDAAIGSLARFALPYLPPRPCCRVGIMLSAVSRLGEPIMEPTRTEGRIVTHTRSRAWTPPPQPAGYRAETRTRNELSENERRAPAGTVVDSRAA
jgi:hypothetical protein